MSALLDFDRLRRLPGVRTAGELAGARPVFPVAHPLDAVFARGGLARGEVTAFTGGHAFSCALATVAKATREHHWCASVGVGTPAVAGLTDFDIDLGHYVNVTVTPENWLQALSILVDTFAIVITRPIALSPGQRNRLSGKVREKNMALIVLDAFPHAGERIAVSHVTWEGISHGTGSLQHCNATLTNLTTGACQEVRFV